MDIILNPLQRVRTTYISPMHAALTFSSEIIDVDLDHTISYRCVADDRHRETVHALLL